MKRQITTFKQPSIIKKNKQSILEKYHNQTNPPYPEKKSIPYDNSERQQITEDFPYSQKYERMFYRKFGCVEPQHENRAAEFFPLNLFVEYFLEQTQTTIDESVVYYQLFLDVINIAYLRYMIELKLKSHILLEIGKKNIKFDCSKQPERFYISLSIEKTSQFVKDYLEYLTDIKTHVLTSDHYFEEEKTTDWYPLIIDKKLKKLNLKFLQTYNIERLYDSNDYTLLDDSTYKGSYFTDFFYPTNFISYLVVGIDLPKMIPQEWKKLLALDPAIYHHFNNPSFDPDAILYHNPILESLSVQLCQEYRTKLIFPPIEKVFNSLYHTTPSTTNVLILGLDPYINIGQANGLCFSINDLTREYLQEKNCTIQKILPPSLNNIFKEIREMEKYHPEWISVELTDYWRGRITDNSLRVGNLERWAKQGVLLLNTILTVVAGETESHSHFLWGSFVKCLLSKFLDIRRRINRPVVIILLGAIASVFLNAEDLKGHYPLIAGHPSPNGKTATQQLSFLNSGVFRKTNEFLWDRYNERIVW